MGGLPELQYSEMSATKCEGVAQVWKAAAPFVRLLWQGAAEGVETQPAVLERQACMQAALLALKLDAVRGKKHLQVRKPSPSTFHCSWSFCRSRH